MCVCTYVFIYLCPCTRVQAHMHMGEWVGVPFEDQKSAASVFLSFSHYSLKQIISVIWNLPDAGTLAGKWAMRIPPVTASLQLQWQTCPFTSRFFNASSMAPTAVSGSYRKLFTIWAISQASSVIISLYCGSWLKNNRLSVLQLSMSHLIWLSPDSAPISKLKME